MILLQHTYTLYSSVCVLLNLFIDICSLNLFLYISNKTISLHFDGTKRNYS